MKQAAVLFTLIVLSAVLACPVLAQSTAGTASGAPGPVFDNAPTTWQAEENTSIVPAAPVGQTAITTDNGGALMSPVIAPAMTGGLAQSSVNQTMLPSGVFSFGFPESPMSVTTDPYVPPALPTTSSGSVDLNTAVCPYCGQGVSIYGW